MVQLNDGDIAAVGYTLEDNTYSYAVAKFSSTLSNLNELAEFGIEARIFPTIVQDELITLELKSETPLILNISLLNSLGQTVKVWKNGVNFYSGSSQETLELPANLPSGSYYILMETAEGRTALPMRKM